MLYMSQLKGTVREFIHKQYRLILEYTMISAVIDQY